MRQQPCSVGTVPSRSIESGCTFLRSVPDQGPAAGSIAARPLPMERVAFDLRMAVIKGLSRQASSRTTRTPETRDNAFITRSSGIASNSTSESALRLTSVGTRKFLFSTSTPCPAKKIIAKSAPSASRPNSCRAFLNAVWSKSILRDTLNPTFESKAAMSAASLFGLGVLRPVDSSNCRSPAQHVFQPTPPPALRSEQ